MKTLIEIFDECQVENVIAPLSLRPEKIVFIGFKEIMTQKRIDSIKKFFAEEYPEVISEFEVVGRYELDDITEHIIAVTERNEECVFDITGGKELILTAVGNIAASRNIPIVQFDVSTGKINPVKNADNISVVKKPDLTIKKVIALNGGVVLPEYSEWVLDGDFCKDINAVWEISASNCGLWNRQATVFGNFEKYGKLDSFFRINVNLQELKRRRKDSLLDEGIIGKLKEKNLIYGFEKNEDYVSFFYKNDSVRRLITKSGNVLELYGYMLIKEIMKEKENFASDCDVGVFVDWDGVLEKGAETRNEIDIVVMKGFVPTFISCKNGEVYKEALYELDSLARRFGGEYAKKVMFASYVSMDEDKKEYIKKRAADMGIKLISDIEKMTRAEFKEKLNRLI